MPASKILLTIKTNTKEEELEITRQFLARLKYSPTSIRESEKPDFEVEINEKLIGIEITKYYSDFTKRGSETQRKISEWKKFAENLKAKISSVESNYRYLYGAIHFNDNNFDYKDLLEEKYLNELIGFIGSVGLKRGEQKTLEIVKGKFPLLAEHMESIFLWDTHPESEYLWWDSSLQSGNVIKNDLAIQAIGEKKENASKNYKFNYYQKWLIIYAGGLGLHDMFINSSQPTIRQGEIYLTKLPNSEIDSVLEIKSNYFTHIMIWDKFTEKIFQLFPYNKKLFDYGEKSIWINHLPLNT